MLGPIDIGRRDAFYCVVTTVESTVTSVEFRWRSGEPITAVYGKNAQSIWGFLAVLSTRQASRPIESHGRSYTTSYWFD